MTKKAKSRGQLLTEQQNTNTMDIDTKSIKEILEIINREDQTVAIKVAEAIPEISQVVELMTDALRNGQRIFYVGAGTSGRLGVLDASEMPPTFSVPSDWFNGIIAGGDDALRQSIEGAEDKAEHAINDLKKADLSAGDVVIGISTSGAAAYVRKAIEFGKELGCRTCYIICTPDPFFNTEADVVIRVQTGPEVITGSTRMKAGTATKMVLNMISTTAMIQLGKVYGNLMVDVMAVNKKLIDRGTRIIQQLTGLNYYDAQKALFDAGKSVKKAIVMVKKNCTLEEANELLSISKGRLNKIIDN